MGLKLETKNLGPLNGIGCGREGCLLAQDVPNLPMGFVRGHYKAQKSLKSVITKQISAYFAFDF